MLKLTNEEKDILTKAQQQLDVFYTHLEETCRQFKWICHAHLPQSGEGYEKNKNVFEIQDKTLLDIKKDRQDANKLFMKLFND